MAIRNMYRCNSDYSASVNSTGLGVLNDLFFQISVLMPTAPS